MLFNTRRTVHNHVRSEICPMVARVKRLTVVIAHESATVRVGARRAVESEEIQVVAEAADAETAVTVTLRHCPDVCLVSTRLPGTGVAAAAQISSELAPAHVGLSINRAGTAATKAAGTAVYRSAFSVPVKMSTG